QGGVRELLRGEDRPTVLSRARPRAALPARAPPRRVRGGPHGGDAPDPPAAREPPRRRYALRADHLPEGPGGDAAARAAHRRARVPAGDARVPHAVLPREREL